MENKVIRLTESELRNMISENIQTAINEGWFDNMKSAFRGARQGYKTQQMIDRGTEGFKQQHDHADAMAAMDPLTKMPNTAEEQAADIYRQYKEYQAQANRLLSMYNQLVKKYGLVKQGTGKAVNPNKQPMGAGIDKRSGGILANHTPRKMMNPQGGFGAR